jgi:hypothetical protein
MPKLSINNALRSGLLDAIRERRDFDTHGAMRGESGAPVHTGYLPREFRTMLDSHRERVTFTVYSYGTPIAWHVAGSGWIVPDVRYSVTTSKHQGRTLWALHGESVNAITT